MPAHPSLSHPAPRPRLAAPILALLACLALAGCAHTEGALGYYWQSVQGHARLLQAARPLDEWIANESTPAPLRARLQLAQRARHFAVQELGLPDNASYRSYADLGRSAAVWNVVAAPPYALELHRWCFPFTGCIGYRGYFQEADAQAEGARLAAQGLEVDVYGVPAYSTLGYLDWAGGDPLLNTFIGWPEGEFVRLLFHELAHQVVYAQGDTLFNESFATAVERLGTERWLATQARPEVRQAFAASEERRQSFRALTRATRARLAEIYEQNKAPAHDSQALNAMKSGAMQDFRARYAVLRERWLAQGARVEGYDRWVAQANNASFAAQAAYDAWVPAFEALFAQQGQRWDAFYDAVRHLAALPQDERHARLQALLPPPHQGD
ncbi:aminopeptidase [Acidovorax sp. 210-6]|jgi:predicted aminopeptidase|uniref:aminopeptidase n=1 Tax=Acidovorax sp. 210-6 TaxID=2699468 RepID=UPI00138A1B93|nr:aminopeptidase [Acidovorax sp. 210-6]NCU67577.1 aminopeptidase [Acidovorax sp. 210-6]